MFRISCSSSLHNGCDEPEILRCENLKSVPQALTSDSLEQRLCEPDTAGFDHFRRLRLYQKRGEMLFARATAKALSSCTQPSGF